MSKYLMVGDFLSFLWDTLLFYPFLNILVLLYHFMGENLGLAVIIFAIATRILLIPSTKKQMEMTQKMGSLRPKLDELNKKYGSNREQLAKEQVKLYKEVGYNPVGCIGNFLPQLFILAAIIGVIRATTAGNFEGLYPFVKEIVFDGMSDGKIQTGFLAWDLGENFNHVVKESGYFSVAGVTYLLLAVGVAVSQFFSTKFIQAVQSASRPAKPKKSVNKDEPMSPEEMQENMMKSMNSIFPLMTGFIALSTPAVLGVYWLVQSFMSIVQYFVIDFDKSREALKKSFNFLNRKDG